MFMMHPFTHPWLSLLARLHLAPLAHDPPQHLSLQASTLPPTGSRPLHRAHVPCSRRDHPRLIMAHPLTTSLPRARALTRTAQTSRSRPPRSGRALTPTGLGRALGPACRPARLRAMGHRGFRQHHHQPGNPHPDGNCGRVGPSTQQVPGRRPCGVGKTAWSLREGWLGE